MISYQDFQKKSEYSSFIKENSEVGSLKINVFAASSALPLPNTHIVITKKIGEDVVLFFDGMTNSSGEIDSILLPAPSMVSNNMDVPRYTFYDLEASHEGYQQMSKILIAMFGGTKVIQYIKLLPEVISHV